MTLSHKQKAQVKKLGERTKFSILSLQASGVNSQPHVALAKP